MRPPGPVESGGCSPFLQRLQQRGLGRPVVLHTERRSYSGRLVALSATSIRLEAVSQEIDADCELEVDPGRVEAFEILAR